MAAVPSAVGVPVTVDAGMVMAEMAEAGARFDELAEDLPLTLVERLVNLPARVHEGLAQLADGRILFEEGFAQGGLVEELAAHRASGGPSRAL